MNPSSAALSFLVVGCLALGLLVIRSRRRAAVEVASGYRSFFRRLGLTEPEHFLALPGETPYLVSGHPDRHVARVEFGSGAGGWIAYLKREHRVSWRVRLTNALAGSGFVSRSLREARTLQGLAREGIAGPEWLAAGEDGRGRAFLLVREVADAVELRVFLRAETDAARRRRVARNVGVTLARLHAAGYRHPDLYANHILVRAGDGTAHVLDWQRARLNPRLTARHCRADLAALHATLDDSLATPRERLACLRAYLRAGGAGPWRTAARSIDAAARRLLRRRHVREKRQPPALPQAWICLDGEALCISPAFQEHWAGRVPDWLRTSGSCPAPLPVTRHWPVLPGAAPALLVRRRERRPLADLWRRLRRRPAVSPEQRQAALLLRLERHGVAAPQVLAVGRRSTGTGGAESFLLTGPPAGTCGLEVWLRRRPAGRAARARRWSVLRQAGALLRRLHEASCYLDGGPGGTGLAVQFTDGRGASVVLDNPEAVRPRRRRLPGRARRDLARLERALHAAGCSRTERRRFLAGYRQSDVGDRQRNFEPRRPAPRPPSPDPPRASAADTFWQRLLRGTRRLRQRADWAHFAGPDWADRIMGVAVTDRFHAKQGRSTGRWVLQAAAGRLSVYLKRHYELPWWRGVLATLWPGRGWSPAFGEWRNLEWARRQGVPVPQPVAAAEHIGPGGRLQSFLAVEELAGMLPLNEAVALAAVRQDETAFRLWKRGLVAEVARLVRLLHDRRCFHKDLYLCHLFVARDDTRAEPAGGWRGRVCLIDLHRLAHHPWTWRLWQSKDLAQLLYSSEIVGIGARDRLRFWRDYHGGPRRGRWLRRLVLLRWRRYRLHNARGRLRQPLAA